MNDGAAGPDGPALRIALTPEAPSAAALVGAKAASLIRLRRAGFQVPDGVVLTTRFFEPWLREICASEAWRSRVQRLRAAPGGPLETDQPDEVDAMVEALAFNAQQRAEVDAVETQLGSGVYAVRSSSPDEDLAGASFAGLYETVLGVRADSLADAVFACLRSCLDERVVRYKLRMDLAVEPSIAVIVQRQVPSEVSGVAFSLNPESNDFDEVLINASWGLGEALVTGEITPDAVVVDKVAAAVLSYRVGSKGGDRAHERCLADARIAEIVAAVGRVENLYRRPVDVEWAVSDGSLHLLQARPVTAYVPLHPSLQTAPGAPRHLYMDGFMTDAITMSQPVTPMSNDVAVTMYRLMFEWALGVPTQAHDLERWGLHPESMRFYVDLSPYLHLLGNGKVLAKQSANVNAVAAAVLTSPGLARYRLANLPKRFRRRRLLRALPGILWRTRRGMLTVLWPLLNRNRFQATYANAIAEFEAWVTRPMDYTQSLADCLGEGLQRLGSTVMVSSYPAYMIWRLMMARIQKLADASSAEQVAWADTVCGVNEDDMIVHMGRTLHDLSKHLAASDFDDIEALEAALAARRLPAPFLAGWDEFVRRYGCRGPLEMELAKAKYGEAPRIALQQMAGMAGAADGFDPHDMAREQVARREQAYARLLAVLSRRRARRLQRDTADCRRYAASREMFKHHIMQLYARVRSLLLHRAAQFVRAGRLDRPDEIFEVLIEDVDRAVREPTFDLPAAVAERGAFARTLKSHVRHFPMFIDSRGRIFRAPVETRAEVGERALVGAPVSSGVARGTVKVLNDPFEKAVCAGDVLVAVTTDPGWTPLFINASAVVLEIGGALQHGALVAREYGKPCVTGIEDVTNRFEDGQLVEVDGDAGVVRFLDPA